LRGKKKFDEQGTRQFGEEKWLGIIEISGIEEKNPLRIESDFIPCPNKNPIFLTIAPDPGNLFSSFFAPLNSPPPIASTMHKSSLGRA
jgi:hypothetical protein